MTTDVTTTSVLNQAQNTTNSAASLAKDFDQFLQLLTTQLQNQDPLDPMDSTEFTNQLVQFSQVEQAINQNQKLDNLVSLQLGSISSVALGYVGMDVSYLSSEANFDGTTPVTVNYSLEKAAAVATINVYDESGTLVYHTDAPNDTGQNEFIWNGLSDGGPIVGEGTYTISVDAADADGQPINVSTAVSGRVRGIESQNGVVYVLVGERVVPVSSILQARLPQTTST